MTLFKALRYFDIDVQTYMETDERLSPMQRVMLILTWRAYKKARKERRRK